jgi:hypothetical protein
VVLPKRVPVFFSPPPVFPKLNDMSDKARDMRASFSVALMVVQTSDAI